MSSLFEPSNGYINHRADGFDSGSRPTNDYHDYLPPLGTIKRLIVHLQSTENHTIYSLRSLER